MGTRPVLTPQDPDAFRATVLRKAARIERRRRRTRALMWVPGAAAVALSVVLVTRPGPPDEQISAGVAAESVASGVVTTETVSFGDGRTPRAVVGASDGAIWVLERDEDGSAISRVEDDRATVVAELPEGAQPDVVVAGADGALWMTDPVGDRVIRVALDGDVSAWPTPSTPSSTAAFASDGRFWFAEPDRDRLTGMAADGGVLHHDVPRGRRPDVVAVGPDGSIFFGESASPRIGSVSPSGTVTEYDLDGDERAVAMVSGPGPALWMVLESSSGARLARLDGRGNIVGDELEGDVPEVIANGSDGRLWYSTADEPAVRQQSLRGPTSRSLDRSLRASSWAMGSDGSMWAVDRERGAVVSVTLD